MVRDIRAMMSVNRKDNLMATKELKLGWLKKAEASLNRSINEASNQLIKQILEDEKIELTKWKQEIQKEK